MLDPHVCFLRRLGFEGDALDEFMPDWTHAAAFLELSDQDVAYAVDNWLPRYWDLSLMGVRKLIAACVREVVEISKLEQYKREGMKILYSNPVASHVMLYANQLAGEGRLRVAYPDFMVATVKQAFFGKNMGGGCSCMSCGGQHCALNSVRVQCCEEGRLPPPTAIWNWGLQCNEAPKTVEMINCLFGEEWTDVVTTFPHDAPLGTTEVNDEDCVSYFSAKIREGQRRISEITGIEVTEEHIRQSLDGYMAYMARVEKLTDLVVKADPQPIGGNELGHFSICVQMCFGTGLSYINDAIDTVLTELEERVEKGEGVLPKGSPKLLCHFQPHGIAWIDRAFLENGASIALCRIFPMTSWLDEVRDDADMYRTVARQCLLWPNSVNMKNEAEITLRLIKRYDFDGALYGFFSHDRWTGALHKTMIQDIEEISNVPHYYLEGDFWSDDNYPIESRLPIIRSICNSLKISRF